jgi:hypothetical protein
MRPEPASACPALRLPRRVLSPGLTLESVTQAGTGFAELTYRVSRNDRRAADVHAIGVVQRRPQTLRPPLPFTS